MKKLFIKKQRISEGKYQVGVYYKGDDHYVDYEFCTSENLNEAIRWAEERKKELEAATLEQRF